MESITIKITAILTIKEILGQGSLEFTVPKGSTIHDTLHFMVEKWGEKLASLLFNPDGSLLPFIRVMLNGRDLEFLENKIETVVQEGDEVLLLPPVAGG
jgi:MoaD family protein